MDQRPDEAFSLVYDWAPLERRARDPRPSRGSRSRVESSAPVAYLSAKLCDVHPDGTSQLVTRGLLNLTHRDSRGAPRAARAGRAVRGRARARGHLVGLRAGSPDPAGPRRLGLAERVGAADAVHAHDRPRRRRRWSCRPCAVPRRPAAVRCCRLPETAGGSRVGARGRARRACLARSSTTSSGARPARSLATAARARADDVAPAIEQWYGGTVGVSTEDPGRAFVDAGATYVDALSRGDRRGPSRGPGSTATPRRTTCGSRST